MKLDNDAIIKKDRLRFTKNKLSANLALLAIAFNAFYFVNIYQSDVGNYYYKIIIGGSVLYNLIFMLIAFLSSEGVKNYKMGYSYTLMVLGVGQIVRIFILPLAASKTSITLGGEEEIVMKSGQFTWVCIFLITSAVLCFISGINAAIKTTVLNGHLAELAKEKEVA